MCVSGSHLAVVVSDEEEGVGQGHARGLDAAPILPIYTPHMYPTSHHCPPRVLTRQTTARASHHHPHAAHLSVAALLDIYFQQSVSLYLFHFICFMDLCYLGRASSAWRLRAVPGWAARGCGASPGRRTARPRSDRSTADPSPTTHTTHHHTIATQRQWVSKGPRLSQRHSRSCTLQSHSV